MRVLGIDPGSRSCGWGVVTRENNRYQTLGYGAIQPDTSGEVPARLLTIYTNLIDVVARFEPDVVAIESIFSFKSSQSALKLGQARGVALLAAAASSRPVFEYNAMTIKNSVGGSGRADKEQVARMVKALLGVTEIDGPYDATDALALAITHWAHAGRHAFLASR